MKCKARIENFNERVDQAGVSDFKETKGPAPGLLTLNIGNHLQIQSMKYCLIFFLCSWLLTSCALHQKPVEGPSNSFVSDGCSCWPDWDYYDCCYEHDKIYWAGGSAEERRQADIELMECVGKKGHDVLAAFMYLGLRVGGHGWLPTPFRWGFGYPWPNGYFKNDQGNNTE